jgi:hypothetical protein
MLRKGKEMTEEKVVQIDTKVKGDIFDNWEQLKCSQDFDEEIGVQKMITTISIRKPGRQDFVRVHPDSDYRLETTILELKEERENYLVLPHLWSALPDEVVRKVLYTTVNRRGTLFFWPVRLPDSTGRLDNWNRSAHKAAELAMSHWTRVKSNREAGQYETFVPTGELPEPEWPELPFNEMLRIAFGDFQIESLDHPVLKRLRGEV